MAADIPIMVIERISSAIIRLSVFRLFMRERKSFSQSLWVSRCPYFEVCFIIFSSWLIDFMSAFFKSIVIKPGRGMPSRARSAPIHGEMRARISSFVRGDAFLMSGCFSSIF